MSFSLEGIAMWRLGIIGESVLYGSHCHWGLALGLVLKLGALEVPVREELHVFESVARDGLRSRSKILEGWWPACRIWIGRNSKCGLYCRDGCI
jgi:hypothetical protein